MSFHDFDFRKLISLNVSNSATWFDIDKGKELTLKIVVVDLNNASKLIANDALIDVILRYLLLFAKKKRLLHLKDEKKFEDFLNFLEEERILLQRVIEDVKDLIFRIIKKLYLTRNNINLNVDADILKFLYIFKKIQ